VFRLTKVLVLKFWISRFYCLVAARVCVLMNLMIVFVVGDCSFMELRSFVLFRI